MTPGDSPRGITQNLLDRALMRAGDELRHRRP
jgi:hypothetical protein